MGIRFICVIEWLLPAGASAEVTVPLQAEKALLSSVALWQSDTGYYTNDDVLKNDYRISGGMRLWCAAK